MAFSTSIVTTTSTVEYPSSSLAAYSDTIGSSSSYTAISLLTTTTSFRFTSPYTTTSTTTSTTASTTTSTTPSETSYILSLGVYTVPQSIEDAATSGADTSAVTIGTSYESSTTDILITTTTNETSFTSSNSISTVFSTKISKYPSTMTTYTTYSSSQRLPSPTSYIYPSTSVEIEPSLTWSPYANPTFTLPVDIFSFDINDIGFEIISGIQKTKISLRLLMCILIFII